MKKKGENGAVAKKWQVVDRLEVGMDSKSWLRWQLVEVNCRYG